MGQACPVEAAEILARVSAIPPGRVATYGDVTPHAPRLAGRVLSQSLDPGVPWHRVVRADGTLAKGDRQAERLTAEGVPVVAGRVDLARFRI